MVAWPDDPVSSAEFMERVLPVLAADWATGDEPPAWSADGPARALRLGVVLRGTPEHADPGGAWTLCAPDGRLEVRTGRDDACELSVIQDVADWRAALWEGWPRLIAEAVETLRASGPTALLPGPLASSGSGPKRGAADATALPPIDPLAGITDLRGLVEAVIEADARAAAARDWRVAVLLGPGPIPDAPQATIRLGAMQAEAIREGRLHPLEALITGQLALDGDLGLIIQLQAVATTISMSL